MALGCSAKTLGSDVRIRENSGHGSDLPQCPLLTQADVGQFSGDAQLRLNKVIGRGPRPLKEGGSGCFQHADHLLLWQQRCCLQARVLSYFFR